MNAIAEAALELQTWMLSEDHKFCVIGGLAAIRWGQYRGTQDVDVSVLVQFGDERDFAETLLSCFDSRVADAAGFSEEARTTLTTISAEDLVVMKAFAGRDHDWGDVAGILRRQLSVLDHEGIITRLGLLCELTGRTEPAKRLQRMIDECH